MAIQFKKEGTTRLLCSIADPCETASDSITVHIFNSPVAINLGPDSRLCRNSSSSLRAGAGFKDYVWQDGSTDSNFIVHSPGNYYVTATNYCNETFSDSIRISLAADPSNFLIEDTSICEGELTNLSSLSNFNSYLWSTGEITRQINIRSAGTYWLQVVNDDGCFGKEYINVKPKDNCVVALYFPKAFTPNKDGLNDQFKGVAFGQLTKFHLKVFSRWGNIVFESSDITKGWDGKLQGIEQSSASFVWISEYQFDNGPVQTMKGIVTLIR
jgi:gliding motility-associated-like protein